MMHVRFNEAWHGKVHKQNYMLSGAQYATNNHDAMRKQYAAKHGMMHNQV